MSFHVRSGLMMFSSEISLDALIKALLFYNLAFYDFPSALFLHSPSFCLLACFLSLSLSFFLSLPFFFFLSFSLSSFLSFCLSPSSLFFFFLLWACFPLSS